MGALASTATALDELTILPPWWREIFRPKPSLVSSTSGEYFGPQSTLDQPPVNIHMQDSYARFICKQRGMNAFDGVIWKVALEDTPNPWSPGPSVASPD